ncbi:MAG: hypothetical protein PWQ88_1245 [Candidatus Methanomethylophilaceae archaeon]|nr:hypothetical protein [Candidatus Methanomethylophilaceae archaeon]
MGRNHARVYSELKAVDSLYLYDINGKAARDLADAFGATVSTGVEDLLANVDAVSICVPTPFHLSVAGQALDAGVPFLIEKPICATAEESRQLIGMIPEDLVVGVGHIERFNPIVPEIKKIVREPLYVEMKRHNPASSRVSGSSVVEDLMIHDIDIMRNVLLPEGSYRLAGSGNQDVCSALFSFAYKRYMFGLTRKSAYGTDPAGKLHGHRCHDLCGVITHNRYDISTVTDKIADKCKALYCSDTSCYAKNNRLPSEGRSLCTEYFFGWMHIRTTPEPFAKR